MDTTEDKGCCFTEGYVKELTIPADGNKSMNVKIEPDTSFKVKIGDKDRVLFIAGSNQDAVQNGSTSSDGVRSNGIRNAVLHELNEQTTYGIEIDAASILPLKQHHAKVRFTLDPTCKCIQKLTVI